MVVAGRSTMGQNYQTVSALLEEARKRLKRLSPVETQRAVREGAVLIDIRSDVQRRVDGTIAEATYIPRNVLEWRCDPSSPHRDDRVARRDCLLLLICDEGDQSSLAAATLRRFGLQASDVIGGFQAWRAAGLPFDRPRSNRAPPSDSRSDDD